MRINAAACGTDLALIQKRTQQYALRCAVQVGVGVNHLGVFAAQLQRQTFERGTGRCHHPLPGARRAGDRDFAYARMRHHGRARACAAARYDIDHPRRKNASK